MSPLTRSTGEVVCLKHVKVNCEAVTQLQHADQCLDKGDVDVSKMEDLLSSLLAEQLWSVHEAATGENADVGS